ncbi:hypothetical protein BH09BAC3_BH09BAC3_32570 [soil metagenome]
MREGLAKSDGIRKKFRGIFACIGKKANYKGYSEETILLNSIIDLETNQKVTDHIWFSFTKGFQDAGLKEGKEGSIVEFEARVKEYKKGYVNKAAGINQRHADYKLSNPTKIKIRR